jgi:hypothetical protein
MTIEDDYDHKEGEPKPPVSVENGRHLLPCGCEVPLDPGHNRGDRRVTCPGGGQSMLNYTDEKPTTICPGGRGYRIRAEPQLP